ncbi:MAG TPA: TIGR03118 family protein [Chitinophagaceae bacterium]|nr:TIGR03118 family protein [Chitinophagaceae bacterium]
MKRNFLKATRLFPSIAIISTLLLIIPQSCKKNIYEPKNTNEQADLSIAGKDAKNLKDFMQVNLVGNNDEYHPARIDPLLVNGWGIAFSSFGTIWISAEATGVSTVYNKDGNQVLPAVTIPTVGAPTGGHPTGQVFHSGRGFRLSSNGNPARFIFAGADGIISGWNGGTAAVVAVSDPGEAYLGIALARDGADSFLYVANFSEGEIEVYDTAWNEVSKPFEDAGIPSGYAPFNIQNIDNKLYVMYAKVGADGEEEVGPGNGYVDIYNPDGSMVKRFISRGQLNAPWGVAKAPATFWGDGGAANIILVGNFGDGRINSFDENGNFLGQLRAHGNPIVIEGLWGISFAPASATAINPNWLYFAAGPDDEEEGLFGYITK